MPATTAPPRWGCLLTASPKLLRSDPKPISGIPVDPSVELVIPTLPDTESRRLTRTVIDSAQRTVSAAQLPQLGVQISCSPGFFAKNVNAGVRLSSAPILVITNNDVVFLPGWFDYLIRAASDLSVGVISFTPHPDCGWCFGIRRSVWDRVGPYDENIINSYDDYDYFLRVAQRGRHRHLAPRPFAIHHGNQTVRKIPPEIKQVADERNRRYVQSKWPGIDIDRVPLPVWTSREVETMQRYKGAPNGTNA